MSPHPPAGMLRPLRPKAMSSPRPWAGIRLGPGIGELWLAGPASLVAMPNAGTMTLDELAASAGTALVGTDGMARRGARFPLLVKVIDAAEWLSLQLHPSDEVAIALYGTGAVGKAEAWVVLDAGADSRLITGPRDGLDADAILARLRAGSLGRDDCETRPAVPGDVLDIPTGTIHAIGAGTFVYEIEQPSDLTFRISDWGRPATAARPLHLAEAACAIEPGRRAQAAGTGWRLDGGALDTGHFRLEIVDRGATAGRAPGGRSPEVVTAIGGAIAVEGDGWHEDLAPLETVVVPAGVPAYAITTGAGARALVGGVGKSGTGSG